MKTVLITGAGGEMGHSLLEAFHKAGNVRVVGMDLHPLNESVADYVTEFIQGDITAPSVLGQLEVFDYDEVYHLAALLSTSAERNPELAHHVNVDGTMNLLSMTRRIGVRTGKNVKFLFPSTIAVYGLPNIAVKNSATPVLEDEFLNPITMYGVNKLYCENLGMYMSDRYGQLTGADPTRGVDFRALRFPGLISATTIPSGGTSDYAPEMIHAAAQGKSYECFVRDDTRIPFMAMPDGVKALLTLAQAPLESLRRRVYNINAFSPTASEIAGMVLESFPDAQITYKPHEIRQRIVDSWCAEVNDTAARADWGWMPDYDFRRTFSDYLVPTISSVYA